MERGGAGGSYRGDGRRWEGMCFANPGGGDSSLHGWKVLSPERRIEEEEDDLLGPVKGKS